MLKLQVAIVIVLVKLLSIITSLPILITPSLAPLFLKYPWWPNGRDIPGYDPYLTPYSNWNVLKGYQPNDPKVYEFMQPIGLPKWVGLILNGVRLGGPNGPAGPAAR